MVAVGDRALTGKGLVDNARRIHLVGQSGKPKAVNSVDLPDICRISFDLSLAMPLNAIICDIQRLTRR